MKKNDWLLIAMAVIFSVLFYKQATGLNYFIFTGLVTAVTAYFNFDNIKKWQWWYYAMLTNLCGFAVFYCNSDLSIFACVLSLFIFSGKNFNFQNSIILNLFFSIGSVISSIAFVIIDYINYRKQNSIPKNKQKRKLYFGIFIGLIIAIIFFALYQQANPLFKEFTKKIDLSWISVGWCFFTIWGFLVFYGLIYYRNIKILSEYDIKLNRTIVNVNEHTQESNQISNKTIIALVLFGLLNLMLILVNALDLTNLLGGNKLPKGVVLSDFVHNAVWSIVFSIIIAVGLIMWFFKDELNFNKQSKPLKYLVYLWIFQSAMMVISTIVRNSMYVVEYNLTYLRIGVYMFLMLSLVGLFFTILKISKTKTSWYLVRQNFEAWFLILSICSIVNWDKLISDYNILKAKNLKSLDKNYLVKLSNANLPELTELFFGNKRDSLYLDKNDYQSRFDFQSLSSRIYNFISDQKNETWQSFNLRDNQINKRMEKQFKDNLITHLDMSFYYGNNLSLKNLLVLKNLSSLTLQQIPLDFELIAYFKNLEELSVGTFNLGNLQKIVLNQNLKKFTAQHYFDDEKHLSYFKKLNKLEIVSIPKATNEELLVLNNHPSLKLVKLSNFDTGQAEFIKKANLSFKVELAEGNNTRGYYSN